MKEIDRFGPIKFDERSRVVSELSLVRIKELDEFLMTELPPIRERELARVKLEECLMWTNKAISAFQQIREANPPKLNTDE